MNVRRQGRLLGVVAIAAGALLSVSLASPAMAASGNAEGGHGGGDRSGSSQLRKAVTAKNIEKHLGALQRIADENDGNRAAGTSGYEQSAEYVEKQLKRAGYATSREEFSYDKVNIDRAEFSQLTPDSVDYALEEQFYPMDYSGEGDVTGSLTAVDVNLAGDRASTSGCEADDFAGFPEGDVALIQRGTCDFTVKATNAEAAGASGVVIFNQGNEVPGDDRLGVLFGTLGEIGIGIPVIGTSYEIGETLAVADDASVGLVLETTTVTVDTFNVIADTKKGDPTNQVVVGAHLDGVLEGAGINDNGSGSAAILEVAIQLAKTKSVPKNQIRFAWWSGEEDGLQGSSYYVSQLTDEEIANTALNLNFDMVGSSNAVNFVYDGDGDAFGESGPDGSDAIEKVFTDYFDSQDIPSAPTAFDGRSDYLAFIEAGIPAGGLFTGAEGLKTEEEAALFGGEAGEPYDPNYHGEGDTTDNIDSKTLGVNADAIADSIYQLGVVKTRWVGGWHGGHGWGKGGQDWGWGHGFGRAGGK